MKEAIREILREFYQNGVPDDVVPRDVDYAEKLRAATVIKGVRPSLLVHGGQGDIRAGIRCSCDGAQGDGHNRLYDRHLG